MNVGRKIYYDKTSGDVILDTGERSGDVTDTTTDQDFVTYATLQGRVPSSVGVIQLGYGQYSDDFNQCNGYRVDAGSGELVFTYPDPSDPQDPPPYQKPLSQEVTELKAENVELKSRVSDIEMFVADMIGGV